MIICLVVSAVFLLISLIFYTKSGENVGYPKHIYKKMLCSSIFLLSGILFAAVLPGATGKPNLFSGGQTAFVSGMILLGLAFGWIGDLLLDMSVITSPGLYLAGIGAFALNHLCYLIALFRMLPFSWPDAAVFAALAAAGVAVGVSVLKISIPASLRLPGIGYYLIICGMVVKSASFLWQKAPDASKPFFCLFLAGAILFFLSDATLVSAGYGDSKFAGLAKLNGFLYFPGQLLCAAACGFLSISL